MYTLLFIGNLIFLRNIIGTKLTRLKHRSHDFNELVEHLYTAKFKGVCEHSKESTKISISVKRLFSRTTTMISSVEIIRIVLKVGEKKPSQLVTLILQYAFHNAGFWVLFLKKKFKLFLREGTYC